MIFEHLISMPDLGYLCFDLEDPQNGSLFVGMGGKGEFELLFASLH